METLDYTFVICLLESIWGDGGGGRRWRSISTVLRGHYVVKYHQLGCDIQRFPTDLGSWKTPGIRKLENLNSDLSNTPRS
jgi:hypothetical protein